jgi:catalase (peroxidase I)
MLAAVSAVAGFFASAPVLLPASTEAVAAVRRLSANPVCMESEYEKYIRQRDGGWDNAVRSFGSPAAATAVAPPSSSAVISPLDDYYAAVRRELHEMMDNPSWDDGSLAPIFIRLAWHSASRAINPLRGWALSGARVSRNQPLA